MPTVGVREFDQLKYLSPFCHEKEHAEVGYYAVELLRYGIRAELAATGCCSVSRFTFPESDAARVLVDLSHTLNSYGIAYGGKVTVQSPCSLSGWGKFPVMYPNSQEVQPYFYLELSKPFTAVCCADGKVLENAASAEAKALVTVPT